MRLWKRFGLLEKD
ncbi:hypothetical protein MTR67_000514 [Solanum verrucosum]|uniref:Uncharacterized protein n=1 Tax=Solanum verrucosum TaxID=315347 RepID=A0AAF0PSF3_SOLVR|nr:hypothetical protein MTR67_000514 [Solanum verrucosum]